MRTARLSPPCQDPHSPLGRAGLKLARTASEAAAREHRAPVRPGHTGGRSRPGHHSSRPLLLHRHLRSPEPEARRGDGLASPVTGKGAGLGNSTNFLLASPWDAAFRAAVLLRLTSTNVNPGFVSSNLEALISLSCLCS